MAGIRSLSKIHETHPFIYGEADVRYEPAEAISKLKGGNSNWRVPVWFPTSYLLISSLKMFGGYFHGDNGAGLGASHQTGRTGLVASLIDAWRR